MSVLQPVILVVGDCEEGKDDQEKNKKQEQRLVQFRQHKVNLIVGTNILESSMALPKCNLIAMFDRPQSYHSYIKTKVGRWWTVHILYICGYICF